MVRIVIYLLLILLPINSLGQSVISYLGFSGTGSLQVFKSAIDAQNNIYLIGYFTNTLTYNENTYDASLNGGQDIFVARINSNGSYSWFKQIGSSGNDYATGLVINGSSVYVTGYFPGAACVFGDGFSLGNSAASLSDAFLVELNASDGIVANAKRFAFGLGGQIPTDIGVDKNSNLIISGYVVGDGNVSEFFSGYTITCKGPRNYFLLQMNPDFEINWLKSYEANDGNNNFYSIDIDETGYYIAGMNRGNLKLDIAELNSQGLFQDMFLYKTDFSGNGLWVRSIKGSAKDVSQFATCDGKGNVYISGYYMSNDLSVDSTGTEKSKRTPIPYKNNNDIFYAKYNSEGTLQWFNVTGSDGDDKLTRLNAYDKYFVIAGQYGGTMTCNGEPITPRGGVDALGMVHDAQDNLLYAISAGGAGTDAAQTSLIDNQGNYILIGEFNSSPIYFTSTNTHTLSVVTPNVRGIFIAKYKSRSIKLIGTNILCNGTSTGSVSATPQGAWVGNKTYLWTKEGDGLFSRNTSIIENIPAGKYYCKITDELHAEIDSIILTEPAKLTVVKGSSQNAKCFGSLDGHLDVVVTGGTGSVDYLWTGTGAGVIAAHAVQNTLAAGTYSLTVTDDNGCSASVSNMVVAQPAKITFKNTDVTKINGNQGAVDLRVQGGTPAYTYEWSGPLGYSSVFQDISGLTTPGNYSVTVKDVNQCLRDTIVLIIDSHNLYASITQKTNVKCNGGTTGSISINAVTDNANSDISYSWTGPGFTANTATVTNLAAGLYSVIVTDNNPSTPETYVISDIEITEPALPLKAEFTKSDATCYGLGNGFIDANPIGGTLPYRYSWKRNEVSLSDKTEVISGLTLGDYELAVVDTNDCTSSVGVFINEPTNITVAYSINPVSCNGAKNDGSIDLSASGGTGPYTYRWSNGLVTEDISFLSAGTYRCSITDANLCLVTPEFEITQPTPLSASFSNTNVSCFGGSNGQINLTPNGGNSPYTYSWSNSTTTEDITGLSAGAYTLTVTDDKNCQKSFSTSISEPTEVAISVTSIQNASCNGISDGSITLNASGGVSPYIWSWDDGKTGASISGLSAKTFAVTLYDANSCTKTATYSITEPTALQLTEILGSHADVLCNGANTGNLEVSASGSSGTYQYSIDGENWQTSGAFSNLTSSGYSVRARDLSVPTCTKTSSITISQPNAISFESESKVDITCNNLTDGKAIASAIGGTAPLTYSLKLNGIAVDNTTGANDGRFVGLAAGTGYTVEVTDANNCTPVVSSSMNIINPEAISVKSFSTNDITCSGSKNGIVNVEAQGGSAGYTYSLLSKGTATTNETGRSTGVFTGVEPGTDYSVEITDANSCPAAGTSKFTFADAKPIVIDNVAASDITCNGLKDGSINITASGGTGSLKYVLKVDNTVSDNVSGMLTGVFTGCDDATTYVVEVTDENNCTPVASSSITVLEPQPIVVALAQATKTSGIGLADGIVNIIASGGTGELLYSLNNGTPQAAGSFTGLVKGEYSISIADINNCAISSSQLIVEDPTSVDLLTGGIVKLFPNPVAEKVFIEVKYVEYDHLKVELKNIAGQAALSQEFENVDSGFKASIDVTHLPKGIYIVVLNNRVIKEKLIIQ